MTIITTNKFISLKSRIKNEVNRRQYVGSVTSYGTSSYDFTTVPTQGKPVNSEHYNKLLTPMRAINSSGIMSNVSNGKPINDYLDTLDAKLSVFESKPVTAAAANTGCSASCTGLCSTSCTNCTGCTGTCTSCTGTCTGGCSSCTGTCEGSCTNTCTSCTGTCSGGCQGCGSGCSTGCTGCSGGCSGCGGACSYGCSGGCTGCGSGCASGCTGGCSGDCSSSCQGCSLSCATSCGWDNSRSCGSSCAYGCSQDCGAGCEGCGSSMAPDRYSRYISHEYSLANVNDVLITEKKDMNKGE